MLPPAVAEHARDGRALKAWLSCHPPVSCCRQLSWRTALAFASSADHSESESSPPPGGGGACSQLLSVLTCTRYGGATSGQLCGAESTRQMSVEQTGGDQTLGLPDTGGCNENRISVESAKKGFPATIR